uniref:Uncharacterized protein n=1 Tax=Tanacetum cinerariifolium TaxID=118510 RepID=A0A699GTW9_TANCI|nr:hypothetical protein [Tanacetum cinerariifolium]
MIRDPEGELHDDTPAETSTVKDKGKGILFEDPKPMKKKDQIEMDVEYAKKLQEELEKAAKRRKLNEEAQEADNLRRRLEIVPNKDDDVFVEAVPLAQKAPVMDYQIVVDAIWRNQKSVHGLSLVKRWKLLTSCGVYVIILSIVQLFLLVERSMLTIEQYLALTRDNIIPGVVKPEIGDDVAYDEWIRKFIENIESNIMALKTTTKKMQEKVFKLTQAVLTNTSERIKAKTEMEHLKRQKCNLYKTQEFVCMIGTTKMTHEEKTQINNGSYMMVKDVERLRQILTPSIYVLSNLKPIVQTYMPLRLVRNKAKVVRGEEHDYNIPLQDDKMQPLTPQIVHIIPPYDDYVASASNLILNKHLNEFKEEFSDKPRVSNEIDSNPINDVKELLKIFDFETYIRKLLHQVPASKGWNSMSPRVAVKIQQVTVEMGSKIGDALLIGVL